MIVHGQDRKGLQLVKSRTNFQTFYVSEKMNKIRSWMFCFPFVNVIWYLSLREIQVQEKLTENV